MKPKVLYLGLLGLTLAISQANAQVNHIFDDGDAADSNWTSANNWDTDTTPAAGDNIFIGHESVAAPVSVDFDAGSASIFDLRLGDGNVTSGSTGTLNLNAGTITSTNWTLIGVDGNSGTGGQTTGTLNIGGGSFVSTGARFTVGVGGGAGTGANTGIVNISAGSLQIEQGFIGNNDGNIGFLNQTGGSVTANNWLAIGETTGAQGTYNQSAGSLTTGDFSVGQNSAGTVGNYNISGSSTASVGALWAGRGEFAAGDGATGNIEIEGSNVTFNVANDAHLGGFNFGQTDTFGNLTFVADAGGVSSLNVLGNLFLNDGTISGGANLFVDLSAYGPTTDDLLLIDVGAGGAPITGQFANYAEGDVVAGADGRVITYLFGDGNDIALIAVAVPEPSTLALLMLGGIGLATRRRK